MQTQRRGALAVVAVLLVGVVVAGFVVLASASGPVRPISDSTLNASPRPLPTFSVSETPPEQSQPSPRVLPQHDPRDARAKIGMIALHGTPLRRR